MPLFNKSITLFLLSIALFGNMGCNKKEGLAKHSTVTLQNDHLSVKIKRTGAEIVSIILLDDQTEYLWQGDNITWSDHAIVQFPIIGNLKDDQYAFDDRQYKMISHGFARISQFTIMDQTDTEVVYELKSGRETKSTYPFEFVFQIKYRLEGKSIHVGFHVFNPSTDEIYFSLGYHPGFNCPLKTGESMEDYFLEFSDLENVDKLILKDNLVDSIHPNYMTNSKIIQLDKGLFQQDAIILQNIKSKSVTLKNHLNTKSVEVTFGQVPYLGIWSPKRFGDFVCIEPWHGIPDKPNSSQEFTEKEGILELSPTESFKWECKITIN